MVTPGFKITQYFGIVFSYQTITRYYISSRRVNYDEFIVFLRILLFIEEEHQLSILYPTRPSIIIFRRPLRIGTMLVRNNNKQKKKKKKKKEPDHCTLTDTKRMTRRHSLRTQNENPGEINSGDSYPAPRCRMFI